MCVWNSFHGLHGKSADLNGNQLPKPDPPAALSCYEHLAQVRSPYRRWETASPRDKQGGRSTMPSLRAVVGGSSTCLTKMSYIQQLTLLYFSGDSTDDPLSWRAWIWSLVRGSWMLVNGKLLAFLEASS